MSSKHIAYSSLIVTGLGIGWLLGLSISPVVAIVITSVTGTTAAIVAAMSGLDSKDDQSENLGQDKWYFRQSINPIPLALLIIGILFGSTLGMLARNYGWFGSSLSIEKNEWINAGIDEQDIVYRLLESKYPYNSYPQNFKWIDTDIPSNIIATQSFTMPPPIHVILPFTSPLRSEIAIWNYFGISETLIAQRLFNIKYPENNLDNDSLSQTTSVPLLDSTDKSSSTLTKGSILSSASAEECVNWTVKEGQDLLIELKSSRQKDIRDLTSMVTDPVILEKIVIILCQNM